MRHMNDEKLFLEMLNNICDGVYFVNTERQIQFWNTAAENITGYKKEEIVGKFCHDNTLNHIDKDGHLLCVTGCPLYATIIDGKRRSGEVFLRHKKGHRIPILVNIFQMTEDGKTIGAIEIFTQKSPIVYDDTLIENLSNLAMNDQLTGIANRRKLESYLEFKFSEFKRFRNKFCVVFLDIDNFGKFNNTYGHETGDEVLKQVSKSVMHVVRNTDMFGRWGGEEFVGVFEVKEDFNATLIAEKVRVLISKTEIPFEDGKLSVTASLGVTVVHADDTIESIIKRADELMYQSKQDGKNKITAG
jgi:diguanylate cyclase (GGDEF)-like protein/PAS domain S-box-containing protein